MGRIVVGVDGSEQSRLALSWARDEARLRSSALEVIYAYALVTPWFAAGIPMGMDLSVIPSAEDLAEYADQVLAPEVAQIVGEPVGFELSTRALPGHPHEVLVEASEGAELLVLARHGRGEVGTRLLGSVSLHCILHAKCPVVVVSEPQLH